MKSKIGWLVVLLLIALLGFIVYSFFFGGEKINSHFEREFTLSINDLALIGDEVYVKFWKIDDTRCKEVTCQREGEQVVNLVVINNHHINFIKLGTLAETMKKINNEYEISLIQLNEDNEVTLKLIKSE